MVVASSWGCGVVFAQHVGTWAHAASYEYALQVAG